MMTSTLPTLLFVDDEARILRTLEMSFRHHYQVLTTTDGNEALRMMQTHKVDVVISDQRMPLISGVEVLRGAREINPAAMRILLTGYAELASIVGSINEGEIFRYIQKPWRLQELRDTIEEAVSIAQASRSNVVPIHETKPSQEILQGNNQGTLIILHDKPAMANIVAKEKIDLDIHYAGTLDKALLLLAQHPKAVLLTDLMLAEGDISEGLALLKQRRPELVVVVVTAFTDTSHLISMINRAQVYRVLPMPLSRRMLFNSIDSALRHQRLLDSRPSLLRRHKVEKAANEQPAAQNILHRVRGYLEKIRA